jgi:kynurenine formamidase
MMEGGDYELEDDFDYDEEYEAAGSTRAVRLKEGQSPALGAGAVVLALLVGACAGGGGVYAYGVHVGRVLPAGLPASAMSLTDVYANTLSKARYVDLTHAITPDMPLWIAFAPTKVKASESNKDLQGFVAKGEAFSYVHQGFQATAYELSTDQAGTQLDPPAHWNEYGATISDVPPTVSLRRVRVVDLTSKTSDDPAYAASMDDVLAHEARYGQIQEGDVVFFRSDWSKPWPQVDTTTYSGVNITVLKYLHEERKILFHGHEALDTDMTPNLEGEAWLMHNNFLQVEGITNLDAVDPVGCLVTIGFAKFFGGTGGYARFVAICPAQSPFAATKEVGLQWAEKSFTIAEAPGAPLPKQKHPLRRNDKGVLVPDPDAVKTAYCSDVGALGCPTTT